MIKMVLAIAFVVALALFVGNTTVTFNPFSVKVLKPLSALGMILITAGYVALARSEYTAGYNKAIADVCDRLDSLEKAEHKDSVETETAIETADSVK